MSIESVKEFYNLVQNDEALQELLKASDSSVTVAQIASERGYEFTEQELETAVQETINDGELSEEELEAAAGAAFGGFGGFPGFGGFGGFPFPVFGGKFKFKFKAG